jgi:hypothetical protein
MPEDLTNKIVAWANEIASYLAQLPSRQTREDYLAERRRVVAGAQAESAMPRRCHPGRYLHRRRGRIMIELLAQRAGMPQGPAYR